MFETIYKTKIKNTPNKRGIFYRKLFSFFVDNEPVCIVIFSMEIKKKEVNMGIFSDRIRTWFSPSENSGAPKKNSMVEKYVIYGRDDVLTNKSLAISPEISVQYQDPLTNNTEKIKLPTKQFMPYLRSLELSEKKHEPFYRTIHIINFPNNKKIYVIPNLESKNNPDIIIAYKKFTFPNHKTTTQKPGPSNVENTLFYNITPEINRALVDVIKTYTR